MLAELAESIFLKFISCFSILLLGYWRKPNLSQHYFYYYWIYNQDLSKIVHVYIVYDLDVWRKNSSNNLELKNCSFGTNNIVKISDQGNWLYIGYEITFYSASSWSLNNDFLEML